MKFFSLLLPAVSMLCCCGSSRAETPAQQKLSQAVREDSIHPIWLTQQWDDKANKLYAAKAAEVEALLQKKLAPGLLLKKYEATARKKPTESLAIFPWVYARYRMVELGSVSKPLSEVCEDLYRVLVLAPAPPSAEYARLRFKIEARTHLNERLQKIGTRLVARYKSDYKLLLAYNLVIANSGDLATAVHNDYLMVKHYPNEPGYRFNLGNDLTTLAWQRRDPKLLDQGEVQFNLFDKLAPSNHRMRQYLPNQREYIRRTRLRLAGKTP